MAEKDPPAADLIEAHICESHHCSHIHLLLIGISGKPIAQATVDQEMLDGWQEKLNSIKQNATGAKPQ